MGLTVYRAVKIKIRILKAGKVSNRSPDAGFTLMELIAVLFIISIMLSFAVPEFSRNMMRNDTKTTLNWIVFNVSKFKKEARHQGKDFSMCIPATNLIQIKTESVGSESKDLELTDSELTEANILAEFLVPEDVTLDGVTFNRPGQEFDDDDACIQFYGKGYSDHAIIHISDNDGNSFSCMIEPFLHRVKIYKEYVQFE
jgi:prepilin-type N-terminal cleavage/methylation domain-containing protein